MLPEIKYNIGTFQETHKYLPFVESKIVACIEILEKNIYPLLL